MRAPKISRQRLAGAGLVLLTVVAPPAAARSAAVLSYPLTDVWSSAVRFLRVDRGYEIREKDEGSGYILFELIDRQKVFKGSLELVRAQDDQSRDATRAVFSLPDLPRHFETLLLDKLGAKIKEERGSPAPPPPRKPAPEKPSPDAGTLPRPKGA